MSFDSAPATYEHIHTVQGFMLGVIKRLMDRAHVHDRSKIVIQEEKEAFDQITERLSLTKYGSEEYNATMREFPAIKNHQLRNDHHPEYFGEKGIKGMDLVQLLEMMCDWKGASLRQKTGNIHKSIDYNAGRFGYGEELTQILHNTADLLGGSRRRA